MATSYKSFSLNQPGDAAPWGTTEFNAWKDLIDTVVGDCVEETKYTSGHRHYKLYAQTAGTVALTVIADGTGKFTSGELKVINADSKLSVETYSTSIGTPSQLNLKHSHHAAAESMGATGDGEELGWIYFQGVNNALAWNTVAQIRSTQVGATSAQIGAALTFHTAYTGGSLGEKVKIAATQNPMLSIGKSTIENWGTTRSVIQIGGLAAMMSGTVESAGNQFSIMMNSYNDGTNFRRVINDETARIRLQDGIIAFFSNASGTADSTFTPTERLRLGSSSLSTSQSTLSLGKSTIENWVNTISSYQIGGVGALSSQTAEGTSNGVYLSNNWYFNTSGQHCRIVNDEVTYLLQEDGDFNWYADAAGAIDTSYTPTLRMILKSANLANPGCQLGLGTSTPFQDVASISGDFTGEGIHIKSDVASNRPALLVVEGNNVEDNGGWVHPKAARIILAHVDAASGWKMFEISFNEATGELRSLDDDGSGWLSYFTFNDDSATGQIFSQVLKNGSSGTPPGSYGYIVIDLSTGKLQSYEPS